jgi:hypothetical protein
MGEERYQALLDVIDSRQPGAADVRDTRGVRACFARV